MDRDPPRKTTCFESTGLLRRPSAKCCLLLCSLQLFFFTPSLSRAQNALELSVPAELSQHLPEKESHLDDKQHAILASEIAAAKQLLSEIDASEAEELSRKIVDAFDISAPPQLALQACVVLGRLAVRIDDFGAAMYYFSQANKLEKQSGGGHQTSGLYAELGEKLQRMGYCRPALRCYKEAQENSSSSDLCERCVVNQAFLHLELGELEEATSIARRLAVSVDGNGNAERLLVTSAIKLFNGHADEVVANLGVSSQSAKKKICELHRDYHWLLCNAHLALNQVEEAVYHAEALDQENESLFCGGPAKLLKAKSLLQVERTDEALKTLEAIQEGPFHLVSSVAADKLMAGILREEGRFEEASELLERALENSASHHGELFAIEAKVSQGGILLRSEMQRQQRLHNKIREENETLAHENDMAWRAFGIAIGFVFVVAAGICFQMTVSELRKEKRLKNVQQRHNSALVQVVNQTSEALSREVTERVELEKSLERKRRDEAIGKLTGNVAHDFNNLLQVIISTNEHLRSKALAYTEIDRELIATSTKSAQIGASIVRQLLAYARQQVLAPQSIPLDRYFEGTSDLLKAAVTRPSVLEVDNSCGELRIKVDPTQLTTSLINLLTNALDAMPDGGKIRLAARPFGSNPEDMNEWNPESFHDHLLIEVIDEGKGLTAEEKKHVFEPFYSTKPTATGTGLGLSSVLGFVQQSGGDIKIFDNLDSGLRVAMVFPTSEEPSVFADEAVGGFAPVGGRVLIVEDNSSVAYSVRNDLEQLGFETHWVDNGREAIELFIDGCVFDAVVSDVRMPGDVSGIELRDWTRQNYPETGFVLMSGYSYVDTNPERSSFLQKPFTPTELLQAICSELQERRTSKGNEIERLVMKK